MLLDCPRCRLTVFGAAFDLPPVDCPGCATPLETKGMHMDAAAFEALVRVVRDRAYPNGAPDGSGSCA